MNERRIVRLVFGLAIAATAGWGLWLSGGPGHNRLLREDSALRDELQGVAGGVETYYQLRKALPETLTEAKRFCAEQPSAYCPEFAPERYAYRQLGEPGRYEICAEFNLPAPPDDKRFANAEAGRACFPFSAFPLE